MPLLSVSDWLSAAFDCPFWEMGFHPRFGVTKAESAFSERRMGVNARSRLTTAVRYTMMVEESW